MTQTHNHQRCMQQALQKAEHICLEQGAKLTPLRKNVLELVWRKHQAIKAYDLLALLGDDQAAAKPPTVYRALDFLLEHGLIHRIDSINAYIGCIHPDEHHPCMLFVCEHCAEVDEICDTELFDTLRHNAKNKGFSVNYQTIEIKGLCKKCTATQAQLS